MTAGKFHQTEFVDVVVDTSLMSSGDALGAKKQFTVPVHGEIIGVVVRDAAKQSANLDIVFFNTDIVGTATNAAFAPSDAELLTAVGSVLVDTWKAFSSNSLGVESNIRMPYWAPGGTLFFQCVTRATPTYAAASDVQISILVQGV